MIQRFLFSRGARRDARAGLDSVAERIVGELGPRPELDAAKNPEHARLVAALDRVSIEEIREDLVRAEDEAEQHTAPWLLTMGLLVALAIETVGALLVVKALGLAPAERIPIALALAMAVVGITAATANRSKKTTDPSVSGSSSGILLVAKRSLIRVVVYVAYVGLLVALTIVRVRGAGAEDASDLEIYAECALMLAATLGPAWLCEWLMHRRAPAVAAAKRIRSLRRRLREAERAHVRAQSKVEKIARERAGWDAEAGRRRAQYQVHHRLELANAASSKLESP